MQRSKLMRLFSYTENKRPTKSHRPAVWEVMLGTVRAMNEDGEVKYFDYDHDGALRFAGIVDEDGNEVEGRDLRLCKLTPSLRDSQRRHYVRGKGPGVNRVVLWVKRQ